MKHGLSLNTILLAVLLGNSLMSVSAKSVLPDYVIAKHVDLKGDTLKIPAGKRLFFKDGARLTNGVVVGNATSIGGSLSNIFSDVQIIGTWNVPHISTSMFVDIKNDNSLVNVFALTNKNVRNVVTINSGDYWITIPKAWNHCILVESNTEIILNGTIRLRANSFQGYKMLNLLGDNIYLHGSGTIVGDSKVHLGQEGEWEWE